MPGPGNKSGNLLLATLAAHIVHLLSAEDSEGNVTIKPFALETAVLKSLGSKKYFETILGGKTVGMHENRQELAQKYFKAVLQRSLFLGRKNPFHKAHDLLLTLCQRGLNNGWEKVLLVRSILPPEGSSEDELEDFAFVCERLEKLEKTISKGNPARKTRQEQGAIFVVAAKASCEVAEEMSMWHAMVSGPLKMQKVADEREFDELFSLVTKVLETANAPYGAYIGIGLSPFDWSDELSIHQIKKLSPFINEVRAVMAKHETDVHDLTIWRDVWQRRPVPKFDDADSLWNSSLGLALRHPGPPYIIRFDDLKRDEEVRFLPEEKREDVFGFCEKGNLLSSFDLWWLRKISKGWEIKDLLKEPESYEHFGFDRPDKERVDAYVEALHQRILVVRRDYDDGEVPSIPI